jgi:transposase
LEEQVNWLEEKIAAAAESGLRVFKGVGYITALSVICKIGDFRRFAGAKDFMPYIGLVPTGSSSGGKRNQGSITKAGNGHIRKPPLY